MSELVRGEDFFHQGDLSHAAIAKQGLDPWKTRKDCVFDENGMTLPSGLSVLWNDLGFGKLQRIDRVFAEFVERLHPAFRIGVPELGKPGGPFALDPGNAGWFVRETSKEKLFEVWGNQLAVGANSFVL